MGAAGKLRTGGAVRAAIVGATGYGGAELLRLLLKHPGVEVVQATSREPGKKVTDIHPTLRGFTDLTLTDTKAEALDPSLDAVFFALPHGESAKLADAVAERCPSAKLFDLAQDFRTGFEPEGWVYGLPEIFGAEVKEARKVACPGCFATAILLATLPVVRAGLDAARVIVDAKTGSSGSGAVPKPLTHHPLRVNTFQAYKVFSHQHETEIKAAWGRVAVRKHIPALSFVPQSAPMPRGIYACSYFVWNGEPPVSTRKVFEEAYAGRKLVRIVDEPPNVHSVLGTSACEVFVQDDFGVTLVITAIDNLVRGASGQAVQCMNLAFGFEETSGLDLIPMMP